MGKTTFETISRGVTEWMAFPEELEIDPVLNGRHDLPDIEPLIASILAQGQLQPVSIRKSGGKPMLTAGFSRYRAISAINERKLYAKDPIKIRCSYTQLTEVQAFVANIHENHVRNQTTPIDDAYNIQRLINVYQFTEQAAADTYSKSIAWIKGRLQLLELTPEAEAGVRSGKINENAATAISKLSAAQQRKVIAQPGTIDRKTVKAVTGTAAPKSKPPIDKELTKRITAVTDGVEDFLADPAQGKWISVDRIALLHLHQFMKDIK